MSTFLGADSIIAYLETLLQLETLSELLDASDLRSTAVGADAICDLQDYGDYCARMLGINPFELFDPCEVARNFCLSRNDCAGFADANCRVTTSLAVVREINFADRLHTCAREFGNYGLLIDINQDSLEVKGYSEGRRV